MSPELCVLIQFMVSFSSPTALLPAGPSSEARWGMRTGTAPPTPCLQSTPAKWDPTKDLRAIASNFCYLENSGKNFEAVFCFPWLRLAETLTWHSGMWLSVQDGTGEQ